ncbi:MAG TPA: cytochrome c3 family protein, partial [Nitrospirota bacterium]|nr:cytochrome c3 family protein [Nitrospirota bacterium]
MAKQKACNICHAGCLDCHYAPTREKGAHVFSRTPPSANCAGGGRSTFVCHAGTMERRRGDSYLGKDFSEPPGLPEDVHAAKKIECVDCHQTIGGMGHIERKATCQDCHIEVEEAMTKSVHKNLACEACHVKILGGYEMTSWGPGMIESKPNPFKKYSLYYGPQEPPILIKDQNGKWMPVKIWPNSAGGIKET